MFRFFSKVQAISLLILISLAFPLSTHASTDDGSQLKIKNFGRIDDHYYRGAQPEGHDYADLSALGIRTVIDLTNGESSNEKTSVEKQGMKYFQISMTTHEWLNANKISRFFTIVNDPANQPVYVHCVGGKHRTGVMTAIYRITQYRWTADQAFQEMKKYKFGLDFLHPEFKKFVYDFYSRLQQTPVISKQQPVLQAQPATP